MSLPTTKDSSTFIKMRQVYWEAKQACNKCLGQREDNCIVSSDSELDTRLDLLQAADNSFIALMRVLIDYRNAQQKLVDIQDNFGKALINYGTKDSTAAGKIMGITGKALRKLAQKQLFLKTPLVNLFLEVETFQFKATADALQTVARMEKARTSYRSGLKWLKNESNDIDPDVSRKLRKFRKVQEHIKRLKIRFDGVKLETMQKIDLFLLSRSNLFSQTLVPYCKEFKKMSKHSVLLLEFSLKNIPLHLSYNFEELKDLNQYSKILQTMLLPQQPSNQKPKKSSNKKKPVMLNYATVQNKSGDSFPFSNHLNPEVSTSVLDENIPRDEINNQQPRETILIDFEERVHQDVLAKGNCSSTISSKYSDDLLSINFEQMDTHFGNKSSGDGENSFKFSTWNSDFVSQPTQNEENDELKFWSLIQNFRRESTKQEDGAVLNLTSDVPVTSKTLLQAQHSSIALVDSKWNDILEQFDPFMENCSLGKKKKAAANIETC